LQCYHEALSVACRSAARGQQQKITVTIGTNISFFSVKKNIANK
jgi:hypothetical protein